MTTPWLLVNCVWGWVGCVVSMHGLDAAPALADSVCNVPLHHTHHTHTTQAWHINGACAEVRRRPQPLPQASAVMPPPAPASSSSSSSPSSSSSSPPPDFPPPPQQVPNPSTVHRDIDSQSSRVRRRPPPLPPTPSSPSRSSTSNIFSSSPSSSFWGDHGTNNTLRSLLGLLILLLIPGFFIFYLYQFSSSSFPSSLPPSANPELIPYPASPHDPAMK